MAKFVDEVNEAVIVKYSNFQITVYGWQLKSDKPHHLIYLNIFFWLHSIEDVVTETEVVTAIF